MTDSSLLSVPRAAEFLEILHERLPPKTLRHSVSTAVFLERHTAVMGVDRERAVTAGLLHDLAKGATDEELLAAAARYGIPIGEAQRAKPALLHGPVSAEECRHTLGVTDEAVCEAIYWHTTGKPGLGRLGLAVYFADYAEPRRTHPQAAVARRMLDVDGYEKALLFAAAQKLDHVRTRKVIDPVTGAFYRWLEQAVRNGTW